jgi:hypothetical protein
MLRLAPSPLHREKRRNDLGDLGRSSSVSVRHRNALFQARPARIHNRQEVPMLRSWRIMTGLVLILAMPGRGAFAQWGYGGWGWGGWGAATPGGSALQGAGYYAMGAGLYNLNTAQARSINADTAMRWNQYVYESTLEQTRRYTERKNAEIQKNRALYDAHQKQLRENPDRRQVENGDALNAAIVDLSDPKLGSAALYAGTAPVPASLIAEVSFLYASERVTIMLDGMRDSVKWPDVFEGERFANAQKTFDELRGRLRAEAQGGEISAKTLREARNYLTDFRAKIENQPLKDPGDQKEAITFITSCQSLLDLMEHPDVGPAFLELRKLTDTAVGNLLGFMNAFNLRIGPATTPKQRQAYQRLYEILDATRDRVLAAAKLANPPTARANPKDMTDFLGGLNKGSPRGGKPNRTQ